MRNINRIFSAVSAVALLFGVAACVEKAPAYEPAAPTATDEVYFPQGQPSNVDLKLAGGTITVNVSRIKTTSAADIALNVTADKIFNVPSSVSFAAGESKTSITITYDVADLTDDATYPFALELTDQTSDYGISSYSFNGIVPASWIKWNKGHMTEGWWGEEEDETLYYQDLGNDVWYCYISNCFDTMGDAVPTNYYFYWDKKTNYLNIPMQYMGYTNSNGYKVYFGDPEAFYRDVYEYDDELLIKNGYEGVADYAYQSDPRPYYDGNGGFYFYVWYFFSKEDKKGSGYDFGDSFDMFVADGFVRTVDYNTAYDYKGAYTVDVVAESLNGEEFQTGLFKTEKDSTVFYVGNYFAEGSGLAFIVPEDQYDEELGRTADGAEIVAGENEQYTGVDLWGKELVVNIGKKSKVIWPADEEFPVFSVNVTASLYSYELDEEGERCNYEKAFDLGTFNDVITAVDVYSKWFTADELYGIKKEYYVGDFVVSADDYFNGGRVQWNMSIEDAGEDADGVSWLAFKGFAPYNTSLIPTNVLMVEWYNGYLYFPTTQFEGDLTYQGGNYPLYAYPMNTEVGNYYRESYLLFGYYYDDESECIVAVDYPYNDDPVNGVFFYADGLGGLAAYSNIMLEWADEASVNSFRSSKSYTISQKYAVTLANFSAKAVKSTNMKTMAQPVAPKASMNSVKVQRSINTNNAQAVSAQKSFVEIKK